MDLFYSLCWVVILFVESFGRVPQHGARRRSQARGVSTVQPIPVQHRSISISSGVNTKQAQRIQRGP